MNLFCFGLGYSASHFLAAFRSRYDRTVATVRLSTEAANDLSRRIPVQILKFGSSAAIARALEESDAALVCVPPNGHEDPVLAQFSDAIARAKRLETIVYLSTVGIYGDHDGGWVDETTRPRPVCSRSASRLAAERAWRQVADCAGKSLVILRLAGIYGPDRNALASLRQGRAKRIVKPGQVFNRIHVTDLAPAIQAALVRKLPGIFNVADDEPAPPQDVLAFAADLLKCQLPPQISFTEAKASMTRMMLSFYGENKRVRNLRLRAELGVELRYPTYREGLRALLAAGEPS
jgi:nucleoside-diphosphate-sugar epimerase